MLLFIRACQAHRDAFFYDICSRKGSRVPSPGEFLGIGGGAAGGNGREQNPNGWGEVCGFGARAMMDADVTLSGVTRWVRAVIDFFVLFSCLSLQNMLFW